MKKITSVLAASALSVVAAQASAALTFNSTTIIDGPALTIAGGGVGTGTATFGAGTLTINSVTTTQTNLTGLATITASTTYDGTFSGSTFNADGTGTATVSCVGDAQVCGNVVGGPLVGVLPFSVDTVTGGTWTAIGTQYNGLITTTAVNTLSGGQVPVPAAAWLFGSALIGLAGVGRKRKMA